jgi:AcrR family transcriptional regulator
MSMETEASPIEQKIIAAAIECIEQYGIQGATNRRIAEAAGVNSAAINYYFRSKDVLIQRVMQATLHNAFDWEDVERMPGGTARERCRAVFNHLIAGGVRYPGISRAHFYALLTEGDYHSEAVERLNEFMHKLAEDLQARGAGPDPQTLRLACAQIGSAALLMALAPKLFQPGLGVDLTDDGARERFVERLVDGLLAE